MKRVIALGAGIVAVGLLSPEALAATGPEVWSQAGCSGCHTLRAAGATGYGGPNLDSLQPSAATVAAQVTSGGGGMPSFGGSLSASDIQALAAWVAASTGGASSSGASGTTSAPTVPAVHIPAAAVRRIQTQLKALGYFTGPVSGFYGPLTVAAVKAFQQAAGLTADGVWGPQTKAALASAQTKSSGSSSALSSAAVQTLQKDLTRLGYFSGPITGFYGSLTTAAVKQFQKAAGLKADGVCGPQSAAALTRRLG